MIGWNKLKQVVVKVGAEEKIEKNSVPHQPVSCENVPKSQHQFWLSSVKEPMLMHFILYISLSGDHFERVVASKLSYQPN